MNYKHILDFVCILSQKTERIVIKCFEINESEGMLIVKAGRVNSAAMDKEYSLKLLDIDKTKDLHSLALHVLSALK